ncbi:putative MFS family arabinose efflux permease [Halomonas ventosae]|uniref:Putative MFS family arabinose efflux permease n=1 Tax=Halomonas ventosae TaxID=229007 RepID=A0A4R6ZIF2_9GAMM|nr:MFS transporter [Halomonas ventosae]TDR52060.1 putative MFS family arabinose efflux permease [Halomonas ventosae]
MFEPLRDWRYRRLFSAQCIALLGTGLTTIALALLAFELAEERAGVVMGTALAIKMGAYVVVAPLAQAFAERLPRRRVLILLELLRGAIVLALPIVTEVWQIYVLIFVLQSASAAFAPALQATIPAVLHEEWLYVKGLSLTRLAHDLENLISPLLAAYLLTLMSFNLLFLGTALALFASAVIIAMTALPHFECARERGFATRVLRGVTIFLHTPCLKGLTAIHFAIAAGGAMVAVNTVVYVQSVLGLGQRDVALVMACFGAGSMTVALLVPYLLKHMEDRTIMMAGCMVTVLALSLGAIVPQSLSNLLLLWPLLGVALGAGVTTAGRVLVKSAREDDRPAVFAAHFSIAHAAWLVTYPVAGLVGSQVGLDTAFLVLAVLATLGTLLAMRAWPAGLVLTVEHEHVDLSPGDPHLADAHGGRHVHSIVIDDLHGTWPTAGGRVGRL